MVVPLVVVMVDAMVSMKECRWAGMSELCWENVRVDQSVNLLVLLKADQ